jgi:hypothetical protein
VFTTVVDDWFNNLLSIRQSSIPQYSSFSSEFVQRVGFSIASSTDLGQISSSEIAVLQQGSLQVNALQNRERQVSEFQTGSYQTGRSDLGVSQGGAGQIGIIHINQAKDSEEQTGSIHPSIFENAIVKVNSPKISPTQIDTSQVSIFNDGSAIPTATQSHTGKVPFSSFITFQKLFNGQNEGINSGIRHNGQFAFNLVNFVASTILDFWQAFDSAFDLTLAIRDLPAGQLAEAQITQYDSTGAPSAATLLLDTDANGLGWFIDTTPWENSEFSNQTTDTVYKSTPGSAAYGHYDLLTTILHELGHIAGFINGNPNFDSHIQTLNNTPIFVGNGFSAALTPDRSPLDSRKSPSIALDWLSHDSLVNGSLQLCP